jgi:hypothetical protein
MQTKAPTQRMQWGFFISINSKAAQIKPITAFSLM